MKLHEFKPIFKQVLSKDDYSELEKNLDNLEIKPDSATMVFKQISYAFEQGSENLQKLIQELPSLYKPLKQLKKERENLRKISKEEHHQKTKEILFEDWSIRKYKKMKEFLFEDYNIREGMKKIKKLKKRITKKLNKTYQSKPDYSKHWLKRETTHLKKMLANKNNNFKIRFTQTENKIIPFHKLELHKEIEQYLTNNCKKTKNYENTLEKIRLAQSAGVQVKELKEKTMQDMASKAEQLKKEAKNLEKIIREHKYY